MNTVQSLFQKSSQEWLEDARRTAGELLETKPFVTIDDVLEVCPRPQWVHRNTVGSVFKDEGFRVAGFVKSRGARAHGRIICRWRKS